MSLLRHLIPRPLQTVLVRRVALASHARAMQYRQISYTPPRHADIRDPQLMAALQHTKFFKEIQANPEVRDALLDAVKVLQEEGALSCSRRQQHRCDGEMRPAYPLKLCPAKVSTPTSLQ